jgi:hypothetical protein
MTVDPSSSRDPQRCDPGAQDDISQTIVAAAGISSDALRNAYTLISVPSAAATVAGDPA